MFEFIKKAFFAGLTILSSGNLLTITPLRCISMTNQDCKVRPEIVNVKVFNLMSRTNKTRHIKWHAGVYSSTFVYSRFFPKIEFFYCLHENAYPTHFLALKNTLSIADKHP